MNKLSSGQIEWPNSSPSVLFPSPRFHSLATKTLFRVYAVANNLKKGDRLELKCERLASEGKGVCLLPPSGLVILCSKTLPGEAVVAEITEVHKGYAEARKLQRLLPPNDAVQPRCAHVEQCGGCSLQELDYAAQLQQKSNQVVQMMTRIGKLENLESFMRPIVPCLEIYNYRNKTFFTFGTRVWSGGSEDPSGQLQDGFALGFVRQNEEYGVLPIRQCELQSEEGNRILQTVNSAVTAAGATDADIQETLKHLIIRKGSNRSNNAEEYMVILGTNRQAPNVLQPIIAQLRQHHPKVVSVVNHIVPPTPATNATTSAAPSGSTTPPNLVLASASSTSKPARQSSGPQSTSRKQPMSDTAAGAGKRVEKSVVVKSGATRGTLSGNTVEPALEGGMHVVWGKHYISEKLLGLWFRISAASFFQTNTKQAEVLYSIVRNAAELRPQDIVLDLYCGTGTIGLTLAHLCAQVIGYDVSESSIADAQRNAEVNAITNAEFRIADVGRMGERLLPESKRATREPKSGKDSEKASKPNNKETAKRRVKRRPGDESLVEAVDVVIVDPARAGLTPAAVALLQQCGARRVVYVSCNAATQARDLNLLCGGTQPHFKLSSLTPCDMFPHTDHIETVAVLNRLQASYPTAPQLE